MSARTLLARPVLAAVAGFLTTLAASAQQPASEAPAVPVVTTVTLPALTPVYLRIDAELTSKKSRIGDRFPIHIDEDVRIGDAVVIPAGSAGEGEVIHAARSGMGGKAGELIIAARFVRVGDIEVKLRSLSLGAAGKDRVDESLAVGVALGPIGLFVVGGVMTIPRDTVVSAKTAVDLQLQPVPATTNSQSQ